MDEITVQSETLQTCIPRLECISRAQLKSQGNIYTFKAVGKERDQFAVGLLQRKVLLVSAGHGTKTNALKSQELVPMSNYLSATAELISIDVFNLSNSVIVGKYSYEAVQKKY